MILFDSNPQTFTFAQGSSNVIQFPDPRPGEKKFRLIVGQGKLKVNVLGPVASNSAVLEGSTSTKELLFSTKRELTILYFSVDGVDDCTFVLSEI